MRKTIKKLIAIVVATTTILGTSVMGVNAEWKQSQNGLWWNTEGDNYSIGWRLLDNKWYYFGQDGYMKTGWVQNTDQKWYYLNPTGEMATNITTPDGFKVDINGIWVNNNVVKTTKSEDVKKETIPVKTEVVESNNSSSSSSSHSSSTSSNTSSSLKENNPNPSPSNYNNRPYNSADKTIFSVIFRLSDLHITGMAGGSQRLYGEKIKTHGIIVLDAKDYNKTRTEIMDGDWKNTWHIEKIDGIFKMLRNTTTSSAVTVR